MNTLAKNSEHNTRLINDFIRIAYPNKSPGFTDLLNDQLLSGTQLIELVISKISGSKPCPIGYNRDFLDNSDAKTITVMESLGYRRRILKNGTTRKYKTISHIAKISDVDKKIGVLRTICYNPFNKKYYYFRIPPSAKLGIQHIKITFDKDTYEPIGKYAKYQVNSLEDVASPLTLREEVDTIMSNFNKESASDQIDKIMNIINTPSKLL